jgi:hypothetical protein
MTQTWEHLVAKKSKEKAAISLPTNDSDQKRRLLANGRIQRINRLRSGSGAKSRPFAKAVNKKSYRSAKK